MILIVEDLAEKAQRLRAAVVAGGVDEASLITTSSLEQAKQVLRRGVSILLLDLQIPERFGDPPSRDGGLKLLRWMERHRSPAGSPSHIIAITGYEVEGADNDILNRMGVSVLRYAPSTTTWSTFITGLVSRTMGPTSPTRERVTAVIITAVDVELEHARKVFHRDDGEEIRLGVCWYRARVGKSLVVLAMASQMGLAPAATLVSKAIHLWKPQAIIGVGICAGIKDQCVELGDVIVPNPVWDYGSGKLTDELLKPDPRPIPLLERVRVLLESARVKEVLHLWAKETLANKPKTAPTLHIVPAVSGAAVVADSMTAEIITRQGRKAAALDMENYAIYYASTNSGMEPPPAYCSIKTVVDFADPDKGDAYQVYGSYLAAKLAHWLVEQLSARPDDDE